MARLLVILVGLGLDLALGMMALSKVRQSVQGTQIPL